MSAFSRVASKSEEIAALCEKYAVMSLHLFGSALTEEWSPETSDFDFAVRFGQTPKNLGAFDQYFLFKQELRNVLGAEVDLVELDAITNPFFRRHLERTRKEVFAA